MEKRGKITFHEPPPGRLLVVIHSRSPDEASRAVQELGSLYGPVDYEGPGFQNPAGDLIRLPGFLRPVGRQELVDIRKRCNALERGRGGGIDGGDLILDPLMISPLSVVRGDHQDQSWRIYLYGGVFAETVYVFENHTYRPVASTAPFYRDRRVLTACNDMRMLLTLI